VANEVLHIEFDKRYMSSVNCNYMY